MALIVSIEHADLLEAAAALREPLVVSRRAAASVLRELSLGTFSPELLQSWASFVRRGYVANSTAGPIQPLDIVYEEAWEEAIVTIVSRLDEIGDVIDGRLSKDEVRDLLRLLGEP